MIKIKKNIYIYILLTLLSINVSSNSIVSAAHFGSSGNVFKSQQTNQTQPQATPTESEEVVAVEDNKNNKISNNVVEENKNPTSNNNKINVLTNSENPQDVIQAPETYTTNTTNIKPSKEELASAFKKCLDNGIDEGICIKNQQSYAICLKTNTDKTEDICDSIFIPKKSTIEDIHIIGSLWDKFSKYVTENPYDAALLALTVVSLFIPGGLLVRGVASAVVWGSRLLRAKTIVSELSVGTKLIQTEQLVNSGLNAARTSNFTGKSVATLEEISANIGKYGGKLEEVAEMEIKSCDAVLSGAKNADSLVNQAISKSNVLAREIENSYDAAQVAIKSSSTLMQRGLARGGTILASTGEIYSASNTQLIDKTIPTNTDTTAYDEMVNSLKDTNNKINNERSKIGDNFVSSGKTFQEVKNESNELRTMESQVNELSGEIKKKKEEVSKTNVTEYKSGISQLLK